MKENELKTLAKRAKNRLKNGFWTRQKEYREKELESAMMEGRHPKLLPSNYNHFLKTVEERKLSDEQQLFYEKVKAIVMADEEVDNPLGRLIDYDYYNTLDYNHKQRYIFNLAEKYREIAMTIKNKE